jgi:16S rRNA (guanine527-N7)-methyltransferase
VTSQEFGARLMERARGAAVPIEPEVALRLEQYFRLLAKWNGKINLTALPLTDPTDETFDRLLIEPLVVAHRIDNVRTRWFDLGSGGGSPAIPIKIVRPELRLTMVESRLRKSAFLREAIRVLGLASADVANCRIEELVAQPGIAGSAELVTVRAVKVDREFIALCRQLLANGGTLILLGEAHQLDAASGFMPASSGRISFGLAPIPGGHIYVRCST